MPHYYFDLRDSEAFVADDEGHELPDIESAQIEAVETLSEMVKELRISKAEPSGHPMSVEVRNSEGSLFQLCFMFTYRQLQ